MVGVDKVAWAVLLAALLGGSIASCSWHPGVAERARRSGAPLAAQAGRRLAATAQSASTPARTVATLLPRFTAPSSTAPSSTAPSAAPSITAIQGIQKIRAAPRFSADVIGVFRAGQTLLLASAHERHHATEPTALSKPAASPGCAAGWLAVQPRGHVCHRPGQTSHDEQHPRARAFRAVLPQAQRSYPLRYGKALGSPRYRRIPTLQEQQRYEPRLDRHLDRVDPSLRRGPAPTEALLEALKSGPRLLDPVAAFGNMKLAWSREIFAAGRLWAVTPALLLIPRDKIAAAAEVPSASVNLDGDASPSLPLAMVLERAAPQLLPHPANPALLDFKPRGHWPPRALLQLTGEPLRRSGIKLAQTLAGPLVHKRDISLFRRRTRPAGVGPSQKWLHVRINDGALVAYLGDQPVFAATISPGAHGADPSGAFRTPPGRYRISSKWISTDMGGRLEGGSWRTREVPWVAYYDKGYALHGAWWHNRFGRPRSHGCINLTPADARTLFRWLEPSLPAGWYGVRAEPPTKPGTLLLIQP